MSDALDADLLGDLGEPEGPAFPHHGDAGDLGDLGDALDADLGDGLEGMEFEGGDAAEELEEAVTEALGAEDADEFLGGLWNKIRSVAKKVAPIVSQVAPLLPIPGAGLIGKAADIVGKVAADEADELDALDGFIDFADDAEAFDAAAPVVAGLAVRKGVPNVARMPHHQRKQLVKATTTAARHVARRHGPEAIVAMPAIVQHARRTAVQHGLPSQQLPHLVRRTAARVAQSPQLVRRFARASSHLRTMHPGGIGRRGAMFPSRSAMGGGRDYYGYRDARQERYGYRSPTRYGYRSSPGRYGYYGGGYGGSGGYAGYGVDRRITLRGPVRITVETV